ncbi:MAG TPA: hypothetical protein VM118_15495 [Acidobacteriota bacterium]|nr:hypothetical protein [Acidobacteriota bacterium]
MNRSVLRNVSPHSWDNRMKWGTFVLCALILTVSFVSRPPGIGYDGRQYLTYAENLLSTGMLTFDGVAPSCGRAPGYPAFLAGVVWLTGGIDWVYPIQMALLLIALWIVSRSFAERLHPRAAMLLLVLLVSVWPLHRLAMALMTEPLFMALTSGGLFLLGWNLRTGNRTALIAAGVVLGLSSYVRPVNLLAPLFLGVFLLWCRQLSWRRAATLVVVSATVVLPWTARNYVTFDRLLPMASNFGSLYYMTDSEVFWPVLLRSGGYSHTLPVYEEIVGDEFELGLEANDRYAAYARRNIARDPLGFLARCSFKTLFVWSYFPGSKGLLQTNRFLFGVGVIVQWIFLALAYLGLRLMRRHRWGVAHVIGGYAVYTIGALFPFYAESRFLLPVYIWLVGAVWYWVVHRFFPAFAFQAGDAPQ